MRNNTELQQLRQALPIVREKLPPDVFHAVLDDFGAQYASRLREAVRRRHPLTPHEAHPASHCPAGGGFSRASRKAAARSPTPGQTDKPDPPPHTASEAQPENSRTHGTCCTQGGERTGGAALSTVAVRSDPRQEAACRFTGHWVAEREISAYERSRWALTSWSPTGRQTMTARWVLLFTPIGVVAIDCSQGAANHGQAPRLAGPNSSLQCAIRCNLGVVWRGLCDQSHKRLMTGEDRQKTCAADSNAAREYPDLGAK
jgi:hypothetical protein